MQLEFHQLDRRWAHLRARHAGRRRRLLASLAEAGQQTPIVVIATDQPDRFVLIDGYKRIEALQQLGRDTVEAVVWPLGEAEALLLDRALRLTERETHWNKAGCWQSWRSASVMGWRSWHHGSITP